MPSFRLTSKAVMMNASAMLHNLPVDGSFEAVFRPYVRKRRDEANALMWVRLAEISEQAWIKGRQYSSEVLHEFCKTQFLPEAFIEGETMEGYEKYVELPNGDRVLSGSTTRLTTHGFAIYLTKIEAWASTELGVRFSAISEG